MMFAALCVTTLLVLSSIFAQVSPEESNDYDYETLTTVAPDVLLYEDDHEYIRRIHSLIDAYRADTPGRMVVETNAHINTKYRTWKRNADLINSILALPKSMNDAGRR